MLLFCSGLLVGALVLWLTLGIAAYLDPFSAEHLRIWILIAFITLMVLTSLLVDKRSKQLQLLSCKNIFLLYLFFQFALWPAWVLLADIVVVTTFPITFPDSRYEQTVFGLECVLAGLAFFYLGYYRGPENHPKIHAAIDSPVNKRRLSLTITAYVLAGTVAFFMLMSTNGGFYHFVTDIARFQNEELVGKSVYSVGVQCFYMAFLLSLCASLRQWGYQIATPILLVVTVLVGFASAYRSMAMGALMTWLVLRHYRKRRYKLSVKICFILIVAFTLNVVYVAFREGRGDIILSLESSDGITALLFGNFFSRFSGTESIARIVDVTQTTGYAGAVPFIQNMTVFWLPRAFWAAKPASFAVMSNITFFPEVFSNTGETGAIIPSLIGSLYWIGGLPVIALGMALIGALLGWADRMILVRSDLPAQGTYAVIFAFACYINETIPTFVIELIMGLIAWRVAWRLGVSQQRETANKQLPRTGVSSAS